MEAQHLEAGSLEKMEAAVAGSEAKGFYGLLRGATLHSSISPAPPHKKVCHAPSATISHLPPQESTGPDISVPVDQAMKAVSPAAQASEEAIPPICNPFAFSWGASNGYNSARLRAARRAHQPPMLLSVHMYAKCTWGWGWCAPLAASPSSIQTLSGATRKAILISRIGKKGGLCKLGNCSN